VKSSAAFVSLVTILAALFAAGPAAGASTDQVRVKIRSLDNSKSQYRGKVTSATQDCVEHRTVKVVSRGSRLVKTETDSAGKFLAIGKTPAKGSKVTLIVRAEGACPKLVGTARAS
jgi:hypothetical protein